MTNGKLSKNQDTAPAAEAESGSGRNRGMAQGRTRPAKWPPRAMTGQAGKIVLVLFIAAIAVLLTFTGGSFRAFVIAVTATWVIAGVGLNVLFGMAGMPALHGAAVMALGAYSHAILLGYGSPYLVAALSGVIIAAFAGTLLVLPVLRLEGFYLAIVSFIVVLLVQEAIHELQFLTGGPFGMRVRPPTIGGFSAMETLAVVGIVLGAISVSLYDVIRRSSLGIRLRAIRDAPHAASAAGISAWKYRAMALITANVFVGASGVLTGPILGTIDPAQFGAHRAINTVVVGWFGGLDVAIAPVIGAFLVGAMPLLATGLQEHSTVVTGAFLVLIFALRPTGVLPIRRGQSHVEAMK